ncbi:MAG: HD domain-containing protein [Candidatus Thorarchaeota archaeon]
MINKTEFSKIRNFALNNSERDDIHGFIHVERVYDFCINIGMKLNANIDILKISAILHDIGRIEETDDGLNRNHADISAEKAYKFLSSHDFNLSTDDIDKIIHCIKAHSFSNKITPETLEAKILSDADKLDALGAIGLYRTISFTIMNNGGIKEVIEHLENKILKLKDQLNLEVSNKIAEKRQKIILDFYKEIKDEI